MTITSMTATFGCLQNATLELRPGLNILERDNEAGKSTWCAFLRAMFYGLESRKGGDLSERNRYTPWSGAPMAGSIDLIWDGKPITLRRFPKGTNPFGGFEAVYTGTAEPVPGLTADNVGETLLGCTKEVFERTSFIAQGRLWVDKSADLERRVAALAASGEEDVSFSQAERRLRDWRNQRQSNRATGSIPKLRARLDELVLRRDRVTGAQRQAREAQAALEALEGERQTVSADLQRHAALREKAQWDRFTQAQDALRAARDRAAGAQREADRLQRPPQPPIPDPPPPLRGKVLLPLAGALAITLGLTLAALLLPLPALLVPAVLLLTAGGLWTLYLRRIDRARQAAWADVRTQRARQADREARQEALLEEARQALELARRDLTQAEARFAQVTAQGVPPQPQTVPGPPPLHDYDRDRAELQRIDTALALQRDRLARWEGQAQGVGDAAALEEEEAALREELALQEEELAALELALAALTEANARLQTRFSPALNAQAGAYLSRLTGGRYSALTFTREFQALAQGPDGLRAAPFLSQGTADQAYLALRLAVCRLTLPPHTPLVLDDALMSFDAGRLRLALALLQELAADRQTLLFTCQDREARALGDRRPA